MRLTLRTLLAYLDGVLDPPDREVLSEKVKSSDFAAALVQRIASVMRQPRLSAPSPTSDRGADDPNLMAEYLDSTLKPEAVADFERACIESDVRLAEAAACHQVLTLVLGSPAEVSPALRQKAYEIDREAAAGNVTAATAALEAPDEEIATAVPEATDPLQPPKAVAAQLALASVAGQSIDDVPDYLRRGRWRRTVGVVTTLLLGVGFLYLLTLALAPLTEVSQEDEADPKNGQRVAAADADDDVEIVDAEPNVDNRPARAERSTPADTSPDTAAIDDDQPDASASEESNAVPDSTQDDEVVREEPVESLPEVDAPGSPPEPSTDSETTTPDSSAPSEPPPPPTPADSSAEAASTRNVIGQALDRVEGLIARPAGAAEWQRVAAGDDVADGTQFVNLPTFRSRLMLSSGVDLTLIDRTLFAPLAESEWQLRYGRALASATAADVQIELQLGGHAGELKLSDLQSVAAIDVQYSRPAGADPLEPDNRTVTVELIAVQGEIVWTPAGGTSTPLSTGQGLRLTDAENEVFDVEQVPEWVDPPDPQLLTIENTAREGLVQQLPDEGDVERALREIVAFRRAEVAALAARSLAALGVTDVYFAPEGILNDPGQRNYWDTHVETLRDRVDLGAAEARAVQESISQMDATNAAALFQMLRGFNNSQLAAGGDADLVGWLDAPQMSMRVMAIETLRRITGETLGYRAERETSNRRESTIGRWETQLNRDMVRWP